MAIIFETLEKSKVAIPTIEKRFRKSDLEFRNCVLFKIYMSKIT